MYIYITTCRHGGSRGVGLVSDRRIWRPLRSPEAFQAPKSQCWATPSCWRHAPPSTSLQGRSAGVRGRSSKAQAHTQCSQVHLAVLQTWFPVQLLVCAGVGVTHTLRDSYSAGVGASHTQQV